MPVVYIAATDALRQRLTPHVADSPGTLPVI